jgi:hypothetical protein
MLDQTLIRHVPSHGYRIRLSRNYNLIARAEDEIFSRIAPHGSSHLHDDLLPVSLNLKPLAPLILFWSNEPPAFQVAGGQNAPSPLDDAGKALVVLKNRVFARIPHLPFD